MALLTVRGLSKRYEGFALENASFTLEAGYIMGFIGKNGAGKTTTLKSMLGLVSADTGQVWIDGMDFRKEEFACKQRIGVSFGGADYYPRARLSDIASVTRRFYPDWDGAVYRELCGHFDLDENKRVRQLSAGMKVKFSLALALSHRAKLLILDEPTSGLDPVSRDELVELFQRIVEDGEHSVLFSTHITSDLEKCADYITYIQDGRITASCDRDSFTGAYRLVRGAASQLTPELLPRLMGVRRHAFGFTALAEATDLPLLSGLEIAPADLESIMIHTSKEGFSHEASAV